MDNGGCRFLRLKAVNSPSKIRPNLQKIKEKRVNVTKNGFIPQKTAVLVVDIQGDFTQAHDGSLAVAGTDAPWLGRVAHAAARLRDWGYPLVATQDWHPADHISFYTNSPGKAPFDLLELGDRQQILWPPHCVQGAPGAELLMDAAGFDQVVQKGMDAAYDSYSGFFDDGKQATAMDGWLSSRGIEQLIVFGLATDYCVRATALDARELGYGVAVVTGLSRGVAQETTAAALEEMAAAGIEIWEELPDLGR